MAVNDGEPNDRQLMAVFGVIALIFTVFAVISWGMVMSAQTIRSGSGSIGLSFFQTILAIVFWACCAWLFVRIRRSKENS